MSKLKISIVLLLFFSCGQKDSVNNDPLASYMDSFQINSSNTKTVTILYIDGCSNCHDLHQFLLATVSDFKDNSTFILTKSPKKAKVLFGDQLLRDVTFDTGYLAFNYTLIENFPIVYTLENGNISDSIAIISKKDVFSLTP